MGDKMREEKIVPLFLTYEQLEQDEINIAADYQKEWDGAWKSFDVTRTALLAEENVLEKSVDRTPGAFANLKREKWYGALKKLDPSLAAQVDEVASRFAILEAENRRLAKNHKLELAKRKAVETLRNAQNAANDKRSERLYGLGSIAKRSMRFAAAHERRNAGPGAQLPPAAS
jgi:hypothetical protein